MSLKLAKLAALSIASLSAAVAGAAPGEPDAIIVTGTRMPKAQARDVAQGYVRRIAVMPFGGQYARWKTPVCPRVIGLSAENAASINQKIREIAKAAGASVGDGFCAPNLDVVFSDDAAGQMRVIAGRLSSVLTQMSADQRAALLSGAQPVRWWYFTHVAGVDGHEIGAESAALSSAHISGGGEAGTAATGGPGFMSDGDTKAMDGSSASLIGTRVQTSFDAVKVLVDVNGATGKPLDSVGAYVAMIALAQIRMDRGTAVDGSILGLFEDGAASVADLSGSDRAFLFALYHTPPNRDRTQQAAAMVGMMTQILGPR